MALSSTLDVLAALLDGWATQPEIATRIWDAPNDAQRRLVSRQIAALRLAGVPVESREAEGLDRGRPPLAYRVTMAGLRRRLRGSK